jgi:hypothetical protein
MRSRTTTIVALALAATVAAGCGSDDDEGEPIPADAAASLQRQLDSIESRFAVGGGACGDITGGDDPNLEAVEQTIDSLPEDVDPDVRTALEDSFTRLFELTEQQCDEEAGQETETEAEPPPVIETQPETTETVPPEEEEDEEGEEGEGEEVPPPVETTPPETTPPDQGGGAAPGQSGELPGQGEGGGAIVPQEGG